MIIYQGSCDDFIRLSLQEPTEIGVVILDRFTNLNINTNSFESSEFRSWNNSLPKLAAAIENSEIPPECEIGIEYTIQRNNYRIDAIICGQDQNGIESAVVVELKQWSVAESTDKPNYVYTVGGNGPSDYWHPSYQAVNYAGIIENFYAYVQDSPVKFHACSYLHNMDQSYANILGDVVCYPLVRDNPVFFKGQDKELAKFISSFIKKPCKELLYRIDHSSIRPSQKLSDMLCQSLLGNDFFSYSDEQADAVSSIVQIVRDSDRYGEKRTIIVKGGPGTGKSIVAVNILGQLVSPRRGEKSLNAAYFTSNLAPRLLYGKKLIEDDFRKQSISNLFRSPQTLCNAPFNSMACSLFDEAHRMYDWKGGTGLKRDVNVIEKCINASRVSVFFIDEDQAVTVHDYATIERICSIADKCNSRVIQGFELKAQFRVIGGTNYLDFVSCLLGYVSEKSYYKNFDNYEVRVFDTASSMREALRTKNNLYGDSRMVAGYTYEWRTKKDHDDGYDIILDDGDFNAKWNMNKSDYSWLYDKESFEDVGCIHICQGLDMQYCGVIIGKDFRYEDGMVLFDQTKIAKSDLSSGIRTCKDRNKANRLIRNTYNVLLTRGMRGTFIYCEDDSLRDHIKEMIGQ